MMDYDQLFEAFKNVKVAVIGDVMLDTYWWGQVERISPEAPVPVVALDRSELRIGGAGNVALNLVAMGAQVTIFTVLGEDGDGRLLDQLLTDSGIDTTYTLFSKERKTTNKIRIISRNQQMLRLDSETILDLSNAMEDALFERVQDYIEREKPAVLIFEDYDKGVLCSPLIKRVIALCREKKVITTVDPKKKNFFTYKGVDIFKPNLKEVREGLDINLENVDPDSLVDVHQKLQEKMQHSISFITLSEKGVFYAADSQSRIIPSHLRSIADVSGAGDTVIAVASLVYATTGNISLFAEIANIAGGLVCEEVGTAAIDKNRLLSECKALLAG
ncbi:bifunctional heptose 7-phosphate kinase/heptose 1-phosphate adenyltransferase [Flavihumibacter petaseus]|uniref:Putative D-beta-D-heptose 7-phosphate kinase n=1 Tax=Flavihumibacter petaseus NBRC 106054 TaxID=1220578 RepID=A0A0E9MUC5_9BACT|nr:PfkB family carbohydrate kinase [Flavihumibacter petaseus]GAO41083.1 putative D-beta-D-heptose 7-phosphate kinase [Flavihumibacter petaseus NBRC 106054]